MDRGATDLAKKILIAVPLEDQLIDSSPIVIGWSTSEHRSVLLPVIDYNCDLIRRVDRVIAGWKKYAAECEVKWNGDTDFVILRFRAIHNAQGCQSKNNECSNAFHNRFLLVAVALLKAA